MDISLELLEKFQRPRPSTRVQVADTLSPDARSKKRSLMKAIFGDRGKPELTQHPRLKTAYVRVWK